MVAKERDDDRKVKGAREIGEGRVGGMRKEWIG